MAVRLGSYAPEVALADSSVNCRVKRQDHRYKSRKERKRGRKLQVSGRWWAGTSFPTNPRRRSVAHLEPRQRQGGCLQLLLNTYLCQPQSLLAPYDTSCYLTSSDSAPYSHKVTRRALPPFCPAMTTVSKDAQQSSYPYVKDNRCTTRTTDDKSRFLAQ